MSNSERYQRRRRMRVQAGHIQRQAFGEAAPDEMPAILARLTRDIGISLHRLDAWSQRRVQQIMRDSTAELDAAMAAQRANLPDCPRCTSCWRALQRA